MFLNFSNHPSTRWSIEQINEAKKYGEIVDYLFPNVNPHLSNQEIVVMAKDIAKQIMELQPNIVMAQGEMTLCFSVIQILKTNGIPCVAACSERISEEQQDTSGNTIKTNVFQFVQFREY